MARTKTNKSALIRAALIATPDRPATEIAKEIGAKPGLVYEVKAAMRKKAEKATAKPAPEAGQETRQEESCPRWWLHRRLMRHSIRRLSSS